MNEIIIMDASAKEIAALVLAVQERQNNKFNQLVIQAIQDRNGSDHRFR